MKRRDLLKLIPAAAALPLMAPGKLKGGIDAAREVLADEGGDEELPQAKPAFMEGRPPLQDLANPSQRHWQSGPFVDKGRRVGDVLLIGGDAYYEIVPVNEYWSPGAQGSKMGGVKLRKLDWEVPSWEDRHGIWSGTTETEPKGGLSLVEVSNPDGGVPSCPSVMRLSGDTLTVGITAECRGPGTDLIAHADVYMGDVDLWAEVWLSPSSVMNLTRHFRHDITFSDHCIVARLIVRNGEVSSLTSKDGWKIPIGRFRMKAVAGELVRIDLELPDTDTEIARHMWPEERIMDVCNRWGLMVTPKDQRA